MENDNEKKQKEYSQGIWIMVWLAVLTGLEFVIANASGSTIILSVIALVKAGMIIQYFMHVSRVWGSEESH